MGRLGFVMGRFMPFIAGGWGWAHAERKVNSSFPAQFSASDSNWHDGWVAGAGAEFAINEHWTLKGEYRYFDGGKEVYGVGFAGGTEYNLDIHTVRFGINYGF
jgi:outer membrane immunogenic protein